MRTLALAAAAGLLLSGSSTLALAQADASTVKNPASVSDKSTTGSTAKQNWVPGPLSPAAEAAGDDQRDRDKHTFNTPTRYGSPQYVPPERIPPVHLNGNGSKN